VDPDPIRIRNNDTNNIFLKGSRMYCTHGTRHERKAICIFTLLYFGWNLGERDRITGQNSIILTKKVQIRNCTGFWISTVGWFSELL
jgi:hypothetical protein